MKTSPARPLEGYTILVTRPEEQAHALISALENLGGKVVFAPMIVIQAKPADPIASATLHQLNTYDIVIFISKNAVEYGMQLLAAAKQSLDHQAVYAVGLGTGGRLRELGVADVHTPKGEFSSEGLLKMPGLSAHEVTGKRILIIRGAGGREMLAQGLHTRGAIVEYCEVYERVMPIARLGDLLRANHITAPDVAIITSPEALTNLAEKIDQEGLDLLFNVPLLVAGNRTAREVERLGFTVEPVVVDNPGDQSIVDALVRWTADG